jgi:hypothetical protein
VSTHQPKPLDLFEAAVVTKGQVSWTNSATIVLGRNGIRLRLGLGRSLFLRN